MWLLGEEGEGAYVSKATSERDPTRAYGGMALQTWVLTDDIVGFDREPGLVLSKAPETLSTRFWYRNIYHNVCKSLSQDELRLSEKDKEQTDYLSTYLGILGSKDYLLKSLSRF